MRLVWHQAQHRAAMQSKHLVSLHPCHVSVQRFFISEEIFVEVCAAVLQITKIVGSGQSLIEQGAVMRDKVFGAALILLSNSEESCVQVLSCAFAQVQRFARSRRRCQRSDCAGLKTNHLCVTPAMIRIFGEAYVSVLFKYSLCMLCKNYQNLKACFTSVIRVLPAADIRKRHTPKQVDVIDC